MEEMEGIMEKHEDGRYVGTRSWLKIKNPAYSRAEDPKELFESVARANHAPVVMRPGL